MKVMNRVLAFTSVFLYIFVFSGCAASMDSTETLTEMDNEAEAAEGSGGNEAEG